MIHFGENSPNGGRFPPRALLDSGEVWVTRQVIRLCLGGESMTTGRMTRWLDGPGGEHKLPLEIAGEEYRQARSALGQVASGGVWFGDIYHRVRDLPLVTESGKLYRAMASEAPWRDSAERVVGPVVISPPSDLDVLQYSLS